MKPELRLRTQDHPEVNGRKPVKGDAVYEARFPLEDGRELVLQMGEEGFRQTTDLLLDMVTGADSHNDGTTNVPVLTPLHPKWVVGEVFTVTHGPKPNLFHLRVKSLGPAGLPSECELVKVEKL